MEQKILIFMAIGLITTVQPQEVTVADVCTDSRTKNSFCNVPNNCNATGIVLCYGTNLGLNIACGSNNPYCTTSDKGDFCTSTYPCGTTSSENPLFECTGTGYYPNPFDCTSYYFCSLNSDKTSYTTTPYNCTSGNVFYPSTGSYCARKNAIFNNCLTVNCGNTTQPKYVQLQYGLNKQYYALCMPDENQMTLVYVFVCPANSVPNFDVMPATCAYKCWRVGFFQNTLDNSKYFECYLNNYLRFESAERRCPSGSYFDTTRSECAVKVRSLNELINNVKSK